MPLPACILKVAPTESGLCLRIEGQGTMQQSPTAKDVATRALEAGATVVVDLSACIYLDSTFLGCLMDLFRQFGRLQPPRYFMTGSDGAIKKVIGPTHIDRLIPQLPVPPPTQGKWVEVKTQALEKLEQMRHVMDCHRALATVNSPMQGAFTRIADQIEKELPK